MANASKHHIGPGSHGKGAGVGAMTDLPEGILEENMVLSNRDKAQHSQERGLDSKTVQTEQFHDHAASREVEPPETDASNFDNELGTMSAASGSDSTLRSRE